MTGPDKHASHTPAPDREGTKPGDTRGYPEPQPTDRDDARHRGPDPRKDREDGGLQRDADGGEADQSG